MSLTTEQLAGMDGAGLNAMIGELQEQKRDNADLLVFMGTSSGARMFANKQRALEEVRAAYRKIDTSDAAELVVRCLMGNIARENLLAAELAPFGNAKIIEEKLDIELAQCHDAVRSRENPAAKRR